MTDNTQINNPTLTFDQQQALDTTQKRLANLESEIVNATKVLKGTKMESDRAVKEKAYQESLLADLMTQVATKQKELANLTANYTQTSTKLDALNAEIVSKTKVQMETDASLKTREDSLKTAEMNFQLKSNQQAKDQHQLETNLLAHNQKVAKLKEVISTF